MSPKIKERHKVFVKKVFTKTCFARKGQQTVFTEQLSIYQNNETYFAFKLAIFVVITVCFHEKVLKAPRNGHSFPRFCEINA